VVNILISNYSYIFANKLIINTDNNTSQTKGWGRSPQFFLKKWEFLTKWAISDEDWVHPDFLRLAVAPDHFHMLSAWWRPLKYDTIFHTKFQNFKIFSKWYDFPYKKCFSILFHTFSILFHTGSEKGTIFHNFSYRLHPAYLRMKNLYFSIPFGVKTILFSIPGN